LSLWDRPGGLSGLFRSPGSGFDTGEALARLTVARAPAVGEAAAGSEEVEFLGASGRLRFRTLWSL
jgi:hypothetical protein